MHLACFRGADMNSRSPATVMGNDVGDSIETNVNEDVYSDSVSALMFETGN